MKTVKEWKQEFSISGHDCGCICARCKGGTELFLTDDDIESIQSDAIESTIRKCADVVSEVGKDYQSGKQKDEYVKVGLRLAYRDILSLIPQKEKKV